MSSNDLRHHPNCAVTRWGDSRSWCDCGLIVKKENEDEEVDYRSRIGCSGGTDSRICNDVFPDSSVDRQGQ